MTIRIAVWLTMALIVIIVVMAAFANLAPAGSELQKFGQSLFNFLDRITPGQ